MKTSVSDFYDDFSSRLLRDYIFGNRRVKLLRTFLSRSVHHSTGTILEIGCGSGANAGYMSRQIAPKADILGVDISSENIKLARVLFSGPRVRFEQHDILDFDPRGATFDVVVLPDVYEHIPRANRPQLNTALGKLLSPKGKLLMTIPTPGALAFLCQRGDGLQVVDETVTLEDLSEIAQGVGGTITYFCMVSVGMTNEYVHVMIERDVGSPRPISVADRLPIKMFRPHGLRHRVFGRFRAVWRMIWVRWRLRRAGKAAGLRMPAWADLLPLAGHGKSTERPQG